MLIECAGMVGAGKTTITSLLEESLSKRGYTVLSPKAATLRCMERSLWGRVMGHVIRSDVWRKRLLRAVYVCGWRPLQKLFFVLANPRLCWQAFRSQWDRDIPLWHRRIILRSFLDIAAGCRYVRPRLQAHEAVVMHEGPVHRAVNLYAWESNKLDSELVMTYFQQLPSSDLVVVVQAPFELSLQRARDRGLPSRLKDKNEATIARFFENARQILQLASSYLSSSGRPTIQIDNDGRLEDVAINLESRLDDACVAARNVRPAVKETVSAP